MSITVTSLYFTFQFGRHLKIRWKLTFYWLSSLQDIRLLNAGKPAQHTAEVERELDKADNMIRLLFNDVQLLKDGRHPQAEQMYRRWVLCVLHSSELYIVHPMQM